MQNLHQAFLDIVKHQERHCVFWLEAVPPLFAFALYFGALKLHDLLVILLIIFTVLNYYLLRFLRHPKVVWLCEKLAEHQRDRQLGIFNRV